MNADHERNASLPIRHNLKLMYALSSIIAVLMAAASVIGGQRRSPARVPGTPACRGLPARGEWPGVPSGRGRTRDAQTPSSATTRPAAIAARKASWSRSAWSA